MQRLLQFFIHKIITLIQYLLYINSRKPTSQDLHQNKINFYFLAFYKNIKKIIFIPKKFDIKIKIKNKKTKINLYKPTPPAIIFSSCHRNKTQTQAQGQ